MDDGAQDQDTQQTNKRKHSESQCSDSLDIISLFECPVCYNYILPPIGQCQRGHLICQSCKDKLTHCPICSETLSDIRNLSMEKIAASLRFPCRFTQSGCSVCLPPDKMREHEDSCPFRIYSCPFPITCRWQGSLDSVVSHIVNSHKSVPQKESEEVALSFVITNEIRLWALMQQCHDQHFLCIVQKRPLHQSYFHFIAFIQIIGPRNIANKFTYVLTLKDKQRRLSWESSPISINDNIDYAIKTRNCFTFDFDCAESFADKKNIQLLITIKVNS